MCFLRRGGNLGVLLEVRVSQRRCEFMGSSVDSVPSEMFCSQFLLLCSDSALVMRSDVLFVLELSGINSFQRLKL